MSSEIVMTLYISGPMSGIPEHNFPLFNEVARKLRNAGHVVYNPAEHFSGRVDLPREQYMAEDFRKLLEVASADTKIKGMVMLPGWEGSRGAIAEVICAKELALQFLSWHDDQLFQMTMGTLPFVSTDIRKQLPDTLPDNAESSIRTPCPDKCPDTGEVRVTNEKTGGQKGAKGIQFHTIPPEFLAEVGRVYAMGAKKYSARNFEKGYAWSLSFDAMMRHLWAWWGGEEVDVESGCNHMAHGVWHCFQLMLLAKYHRDLDDRSDLYAKSRNIPPNA